MLLHKYVNYLRPQMCAAPLEMQKRATTISVRSSCQVVKAAGMCGTVRNVCDWHHLMELIVALLCIPDSAAHACGLHNLTATCNCIVQPYLWSIGACTSLCDWHQCFDLTEIVVTLFCIFNSAAHIRGLRYFSYLCSNTVRPYTQSIGACTSMHDQY